MPRRRGGGNVLPIGGRCVALSAVGKRNCAEGGEREKERAQSASSGKAIAQSTLGSARGGNSLPFRVKKKRLR